METYRIEMMTQNDYALMMSGGRGYWVDRIDIEANTAEEAVAIAKNNNPCMVVNDGYVKTIAELEEMEAKIQAEREAKAEKEAQAKARKEEREKAKAEALGLTMEEYKTKMRHDRKVRTVERRIEELRAELAKEEKYLEKLRKQNPLMSL